MCTLIQSTLRNKFPFSDLKKNILRHLPVDHFPDNQLEFLVDCNTILIERDLGQWIYYDRISAPFQCMIMNLPRHVVQCNHRREEFVFCHDELW